MFEKIPDHIPLTPLLDTINDPADFRAFSHSGLRQLADELRHYLLYSVSQSGGHFGAGLGVVELTIALHYVFNTPDDRIIWDVGHQTYPHKILTGRRHDMLRVRNQCGPAPFPVRNESIYDFFGTGHSSTSISVALGSAIANRLNHFRRKTVAVIGDGALTAGLAFEALNHAGGTKPNMLIVLNDNDMSISHNVGALSSGFTRFFSSQLYSTARSTIKYTLKPMPVLSKIIRQMETQGKGMMVPPSMLFEALNCHYLGPVDGHDIGVLVKTLGNARQLEGVQVLHIRTVKGKGFIPAEKDPIGYHALSKIDPLSSSSGKKLTWSNVFGRWICDTAEKENKLVAITPAMREGSDLVAFSRRYQERYFDVGIAEQHALTFAAGMACEGFKPVVAIYSTFLQRAYDQLIHDICLQNIDVTLAVDRAGLVGEDGPTHHGCFDLSFCRCLPNMVILVPADKAELRAMLSAAWLHPGPAMVRYPRGETWGETGDTIEVIEPGKARIVRTGSKDKPLLLAYGTMVRQIEQAAARHDCTLVNMRSVKPLDEQLLHELIPDYSTLVCVEEHMIAGGAGSFVLEWMQFHGYTHRVHLIGIADTFIPHGSRQFQLEQAGLGSEQLTAKIDEIVQTNGISRSCSHRL